MGAVTYPTPAVVEMLNSEFIALKLTPDSEPQASEFFIRWTPALYLLDADGKPHHEMIGFVPPEEFLPNLLLGKALCLFAHRRFDEAEEDLERLLHDHPQSHPAPKAVYYRAICRYRLSHDASNLKEGHKIIAAQYPNSQWVARTSPYLLIG